jgi:hypothetical protein
MLAVEAARVLEQNELIFTMMDVVDSPSLHPSAVPVPFLSGLTYLPAGAVTIAKSTGASLLICLIHRSPDWRHQVIEISAPIPTEGDTNEINRSCVRFIEDAIRSEPAHWRYWFYSTMASIGLLPGNLDATLSLETTAIGSVALIANITNKGSVGVSQVKVSAEYDSHFGKPMKEKIEALAPLRNKRVILDISVSLGELEKAQRISLRLQPIDEEGRDLAEVRKSFLVKDLSGDFHQRVMKLSPSS